MLETLDDDTLIARVPDMITADLDGSALILNSASDNFIELNAVAATLWHFIEAPLSLGALCDTIMETHDVSRDICRSHVIEWIGEMRALGLIALGERTGQGS